MGSSVGAAVATEVGGAVGADAATDGAGVETMAGAAAGPASTSEVRIQIGEARYHVDRYAHRESDGEGDRRPTRVPAGGGEPSAPPGDEDDRRSDHRRDDRDRQAVVVEGVEEGSSEVADRVHAPDGDRLA